MVVAGMGYGSRSMKVIRKIWLPACNVIGLLFLLSILGPAEMIHSVSRPLPNGFSRSMRGVTRSGTSLMLNGRPLPRGFSRSTGFVTRSGTHLMLNGQPLRFAGANIHWLALDDSTNYPSQFRVNDALDAAKEMGLTVIRSHDLGISTGCPNCIC